VKVGLVPASRTIFDQELAVSVGDRALDAMRMEALEPVAPDTGLTENGLVQRPVEAERVSRLFNESGVAGVIIGALNFGNEIPAVLAAAGRAEDRPVLLFGIGEEGELEREASACARPPRRRLACRVLLPRTGADRPAAV
jgi:L-fucose isomerase-like protein